jgi:hypothetical protein
MVDEELLISDVLAGINYLTSIQFPPFPEKGLSRHGVADLYNARKVHPPLTLPFYGLTHSGHRTDRDVVSVAFGLHDTHAHRKRTLDANIGGTRPKVTLAGIIPGRKRWASQRRRRRIWTCSRTNIQRSLTSTCDGPPRVQQVDRK